MILVGLSAVLLAMHWQRRRAAGVGTVSDGPKQRFEQRQLRRRTLASSLLGLLGAAITAYETVPPTALSITAYLFGLIFLTCWILSLGVSDWVATRQFRQREQIDRLADKLRQADRSPTSKKSAKT